VTNSDNSSSGGTTTAALAVLASSVGDPAGTRTIASIVLLLAVLGTALVMVAFWLFRLTRPDKELLAPLEVMGERKWRRADPVWQRRRLDQVRPTDAQPLQPSAAPPDFDEAFFEQPAAAGFDDLHDDTRDATHASADSSPPVDEPDAAPAEVGAPAAVAAAPQPDANGASADAKQMQPVASLTPLSQTPIGIERPLDLPEREIDPDVLAAAIAELDAELRLGHEGKPQTSD